MSEQEKPAPEWARQQARAGADRLAPELTLASDALYVITRYRETRDLLAKHSATLHAREEADEAHSLVKAAGSQVSACEHTLQELERRYTTLLHAAVGLSTEASDD